MRKVVMFNRISVDGFFAGPDGNIDWFLPDPEVDQAAHQLMRPDSVIFGRVTYQMFESYWPGAARDPNAPAGTRQMANELNVMTKLVFSKTLKEVTWENSKLFNKDLIGEIKKIKQGAGQDLVIFGSGSIVRQLANAGLMDEYVILVTPIALGKGKSLFAEVNKSELKLLEARGFSSGNVLLHYRVANKGRQVDKIIK